MKSLLLFLFTLIATVAVFKMLPVPVYHNYELHSDWQSQWELFDGHAPIEYGDKFYISKFERHDMEILIVASKNSVRFFAKDCNGNPEMSGGLMYLPSVPVRYADELKELTWREYTEEEAKDLVLKYTGTQRSLKFVN